MNKILLIFIFLILISFLRPNQSSALTKTIFISEILPDAEGADSGKEWIEVFNYSDKTINIKDYYFINRSPTGTERKITITQSLNMLPKQYYLISEGAINVASESIYLIGAGKINMFNDESDLELYDSNNNYLDSVHYSKPIEGKSLERKGPEDILDCSKLVLNSNTPTILVSNLARDPVCYGEPATTPQQPTDACLSISLLLDNLVGSNICTRGNISSVPNILGEKVLYLQDAGVGMKVKLKSDLSFNLKDGDKVKVSGALKKVTDGLYISTDNVELISQGSIFPAHLVDLNSQKYSLVNYSGEIVKNYSKSTDLKFNDSTIRVSVLASTEITMPERVLGDILDVTGILVEESGIFKILPRYQEDISIHEEEVKATSTLVTENENSTSITPTIKKSVSMDVFSILPSMSTNKLLSKTILVKYSINRFWIIFIVMIIYILFTGFIFRKELRNLLIKFQNPKDKKVDTESKLDFEKDKYAMVFGG